ncbi:RNA helicase family protein [Striga asiatica]|uniref:RNA helicase n=1 Tax=Striga asiatica TaxID=4170 RepID=A0A5A7PGQ7_STRAF|nr:RNA helicase family protein [Striga asiatica]
MPSMASSSSTHIDKINQLNGPNADFVVRKQQLEKHRKALPIAAVQKRLLEEVSKNDVLIIVGETGSGKTTQLPQYLCNGGFCRNGGIIGVTQPRRVAAVTVAKRVAEECGVALGQKVGYAIRFEDVTSGSTKIKYMTDGLLLREALLDPYLSKYSVIIVDEAHERTVQTDVLLGLLKSVQRTRSSGASYMKHNNGHIKAENGVPLEKEHVQSTSSLKHNRGKKLYPLKLIIMSASLDAQIFSKYFGGARAVHVQGRQYPVDVLYTRQPETDYLDAALITIFQIHLEEGPGDILVFLTGQEEIESIERLVQERLPKLTESKRNLSVVSIFASLPSEKQMKVFLPAPAGFRKVILATNIAETSVTIPGIKYVIDPGMVKVRTYDPSTGIEPLIIVKTSKAQALQRSGRAGREGPGKCYRLYPENEFYKLKDSTTPEIKRSNLSNVILQLKALGIDDIVGFDFIEQPDRMSIVKSMELLFLLGALTENSKLSDPVGNQMARLPLDPIYSKALVVANQFNCLEEMLIVVAMLSVESIFYAPREKLEESRTALRSFSSPDGDHLTLLNTYRASDEFLEKSKQVSSNEKAEKKLRKWCKENFINSRSLKHARDIHSQIRKNVEQMGLSVTSCGDDMLPLRRCLAASFFLNAALKQPDGTYRALSSGLTVQIHPSSVLFRGKPECIIFDELVRTNQNYVRNVSRIDYLWLSELAPQCYALRE